MRKLLTFGVWVIVAACGSTSVTTTETPTTTTTQAPITTTTVEVVTSGHQRLEAAFDANDATLLTLEEVNDEDLQAELARIERAARREADRAGNRLRGFRERVVAYWVDFWAEAPVPRDSLEGAQVRFVEEGILREIDFTLSQVESNVEAATRNAEYAARRAARDRLNEVEDRYYRCLAVSSTELEDDDWGTAEDIVTGCGTLLGLGPPEWPAHDWSCVRNAVEAVLLIRPDNYSVGESTAGYIGRAFECLGLEQPEFPD